MNLDLDERLHVDEELTDSALCLVTHLIKDNELLRASNRQKDRLNRQLSHDLDSLLKKLDQERRSAAEK